MVFSLLSSSKSFRDPWIGHPGLNRMGVHAKRMSLAAACASVRRNVSIRKNSTPPSDKWREAFDRDGYVKIENFLPDKDFENLIEEVRFIAEQTEKQTPFPEPAGKGFHPPVQTEWGFDRFDGGTLNRFIDIVPAQMPFSQQFTSDHRLQSISRMIVGAPAKREQIRIYQTVHGDDKVFPDLQKYLHRDTFHSAMKFWFYIDPVTVDQGPFVFVPKSHRLTRERLEWERQMACAAAERARADKPASFGGAFRIKENDLAALGLPDPKALPVAQNTLIVADTLGFHRRGDAAPGEKRLAIYGACRPWPFRAIGS